MGGGGGVPSEKGGVPTLEETMRKIKKLMRKDIVKMPNRQ